MADETGGADASAAPADCVFCKVVAGEIPADVVHEGDLVLAFRDLAPVAPTHVLAGRDLTWPPG